MIHLPLKVSMMLAQFIDNALCLPIRIAMGVAGRCRTQLLGSWQNNAAFNC